MHRVERYVKRYRTRCTILFNDAISIRDVSVRMSRQLNQYIDGNTKLTKHVAVCITRLHLGTCTLL